MKTRIKTCEGTLCDLPGKHTHGNPERVNGFCNVAFKLFRSQNIYIYTIKVKTFKYDSNISLPSVQKSKQIIQKG